MTPEAIVFLILFVAALVAATVAIARAVTLADVISSLTWEIDRVNAEIADLKAREAERRMGLTASPPDDRPEDRTRRMAKDIMTQWRSKR